MNRIFEQGGKAVNKNTAMAMSGGTNYEPSHKDISNIDFFKIKPLLPDIPKNNPVLCEQAKNIGERRSRLVVVGWFGHGKWLCRCDCGYYVTRKLSFLQKKEFFDACVDCRFVIEKRRNSYRLATGKDITHEQLA